jgi:hypothetical protein
MWHCRIILVVVEHARVIGDGRQMLWVWWTLVRVVVWQLCTLHSPTHSGWTPPGVWRSPDGLHSVQVESTLNTTKCIFVWIIKLESIWSLPGVCIDSVWTLSRNVVEFGFIWTFYVLILELKNNKPLFPSLSTKFKCSSIKTSIAFNTI